MNALLAWYFVAVWGSGYVATKIGLQYAPPFTFLTLRFGFGLLCLAPVVLLWKPRWPESRAELGHLVVAGLLMHAVQLGASHYAQYLGMSAGVTALVISTQPLLTAIIASRWMHARLAPGQWAGVFIGLAGVALVVAQDRYPRGHCRQPRSDPDRGSGRNGGDAISAHVLPAR